MGFNSGFKGLKKHISVWTGTSWLRAKFGSKLWRK